MCSFQERFLISIYFIKQLKNESNRLCQMS